MMSGDDHRSFADPETEFILEKSDTPVDVDGLKIGEPTGEVTCSECGRSAAAPEYIAHLPDCPQSDVRSRWWWQTHFFDERPSSRTDDQAESDDRDE